jgi:tripartite-type tricarboxylate transporter receptor subunit TctC
VQAQGSYPSKPIHIIVPSAAGGASDLVARLLSERMSKALGTSIIVENKPGAGNIIGTAYVAKSAPDGYTFLLTYTDHVFNPYLHKHLTFDAAKDFLPVAYVGTVPQVIIASNALPVNTLQELIAYARAHPGKLNFGSVGAGSSLHLAGELFKSLAGVDIMHVPYNGGPAATVAVISGEVQLLFPTLSSARKAVEAGQIKALAVGSDKRAPQMPDVPTAAQAGLPGYEAAIWYALLAPAGTPRDIVLRINQEVNRALADPKIAATLDQQGFALKPGTPEDLGAVMKRDSERWGKVIRDARIEPAD